MKFCGFVWKISTTTWGWKCIMMSVPHNNLCTTNYYTGIFKIPLQFRGSPWVKTDNWVRNFGHKSIRFNFTTVFVMAVKWSNAAIFCQKAAKTVTNQLHDCGKLCSKIQICCQAGEMRSHDHDVCRGEADVTLRMGRKYSFLVHCNFGC